MNYTVRNRTVAAGAPACELWLVEWWIEARQRCTIFDVYGRILEETDTSLRWAVSSTVIAIPVGASDAVVNSILAEHESALRADGGGQPAVYAPVPKVAEGVSGC